MNVSVDVLVPDATDNQLIEEEYLLNNFVGTDENVENIIADSLLLDGIKLEEGEE